LIWTERVAVLAGRQFGPHQRGRHPDAGTGIGRAADDVQQGALPHVHLAHAQAVGIGMLDGFLDLAHHDLGERGRDGTKVFDLQPAHREHVGDLLGGQRRVAELAQPGLGKLHGVGGVR
jgi:hypothetical protein